MSAWRTLLVLPALFGLMACGGTSGAEEPADEAWRSALYPAEWTPEATDEAGRFLPDVSYAGYRGGGSAFLAVAEAPVVDVVDDFGADPTGRTDATAAFQAALDHASPSSVVVHVPPGLFRVDGLLAVSRSGVVLRGEGPFASRILFTRHESMTGKSHLTFRGQPTVGGDHALAVDGEAGADAVFVGDATGLAVGDDVLVGWTITEAFVAEHGMSDTWQAFNETWQAFFRREVRTVDTSSTPHRVQLDVPLRYVARVRDGASLRVETGPLEEVGVFDLGLANAVGWDAAWANARVHVLGLVNVQDACVQNVRTYAPAAGDGDHLQNGGILVSRSKRVTLADCRMERAQNRGGGGCGYLFEILQCSEVLTRDCVAVAGRHNFIQNWGFGTTGCVWLRCHTAEGFAVSTPALPFVGQLGLSEYHHSLAMANVVDGCRVDDGWGAGNRHLWSSGAGHTATGCVFWNVAGEGVLRSRQFGWGYVIGTAAGLAVETSTGGSAGEGTEPADWREGIGDGAALEPRSLYEDQFRRRTGNDPESVRRP